MKILHISEYAKGGQGTYINDVVAYQSRDHEVHLLLPSVNTEKNIPLPKERVKIYKYKRQLKYVLSAILEIYRCIQKIEPDIIHLHGTFAGVYTRCIYFFKKRNVRIIYCPHGWSFLMDAPRWKRFLYGCIEWMLSSKTDVIVNISKDEYERSLKYGIPKEKSVLIYNGVRASKAKSKIAVDSSKINLLFVGRFDKQKGFDILLNVLNKLNSDKIKLHVIGDFVLNNKSMKMPDNVEWYGWIDHEQIDDYYSSFDAVVMPSRWEGFGLVAVEAMRNKKPVIASNVGGLSEIVTDSYNGRLFNSKDELADILRNLKKEELRQYGENGYKTYKERYQSERMNAEILELYKEVCHANHSTNAE